MKRLLSLFMLAALMLSLIACGGEKSAGLSEHDTGNDFTQSNSEPTPVTEPELTSFEKLFQYGPLPAADENGLWGFIDSTGAYVISPAYLEAERFGKDGLALVQDQNGLYGYLNPSGQFAIAPQFESAHSFSNGLAVASGDGILIHPASLPLRRNLKALTASLTAWPLRQAMVGTGILTPAGVSSSRRNFLKRITSQRDLPWSAWVTIYPVYMAT